ncbi:MAG: S8 family serine peptidase [Atopobiaceae bacterium]|nr:S8 family serine peptidase [Atopobiaceae bacterium]
MKSFGAQRRKLISLLIVAMACLALLPHYARADEIEDMLTAGTYVEGEVIAAFSTTDGNLVTQVDAPYEVKPLMTVDSSAARSADGALIAQSTGNLTLSSVTSGSLSTEELLRSLANDPNVAFAEPNYTFTLEGAEEASYLTSQADASTIGDLTALQWDNWSSATTMHAGTGPDNPSINVPNFGSSSHDANMEKPVVVALLDTAVYYQHPDLQNVIYQFSPEQQASLGCWEYGYKAGDKGAHGDYYDPASLAIGHGTHTAGILGAEWNGFGTSGVASNVRIVSIDFSGENLSVSLADAICAYDFVDRFNKQASEDDLIKVTSNSWGCAQSSRALDAAVRQLGEKWGIVSVFSAGNDGRNNDHYERPNSFLVDNPYGIIVANSTANETLPVGSEYGTATVDLAAPGTNILSTVIESQGQYISDATRSTDPFYVGFDDNDAVKVTVSQLYQEGKPDLWHDGTVVSTGIGEQVSGVRACGTGSLKVKIDPSLVVDTNPYIKFSQYYDLQLDIDLPDEMASDIEGTPDLHLGFALAGGTGSIGVMTVATETNLAPLALNLGPMTDSPSEWTYVDKVVTMPGPYDKVIEGEPEPTGKALRPEDDHLVIKLRIALPEGCDTIYLDSIGLGTQTVPYGFMSGTSMAAPHVSGAAAILASQGYSGAELASLVRSKVRIPDPALEVKSGGILDLLVAGSPDVGEDDALAPDIVHVTVDGTTVTITGANFGSKSGKVDLARYVAGADLQPVSASVESWSDTEVVLSLDAPFEGILSAVLTNAAGKYDTNLCFVSKGANVYEQDLPFDAGVGDVFVHGDDQGDWEPKGPLVGLGCKLYYLPAYEGYSDEQPSHRRMLCFDLKTQTWSELAELPEWLSGVSATMYEGKIVVEGATMYLLDNGEPSTQFPRGESAEERVYVYDPTTSKWEQASSEGVYLNQTIVNDDGQLRLVGGSMPDPANPERPWMTVPVPVLSYDLATGAGEELCAMPVAFTNPQVAAKDGTILAYSDGVEPSANPAPEIVRIQDGEATKLEGALPEYLSMEEAKGRAFVLSDAANYPYHAVVAPVSEGFVLVGPPAADGSSDTYVLRDGSDVFEPYEKRSSEDCVYSQAACTYRGRLFVIGSAIFEPENRIFRATAMEVPEYPGDIPCEEVDPEPEPEPEPDPEPQPEPEPEPKPTPAPTPKDNPSPSKKKALPQTGDDATPLLATCLAGTLAIAMGAITRRRA